MLKELVLKLMGASIIGIITMILALASDQAKLKGKLESELKHNLDFHKEISSQLKEIRALQFRTLEKLGERNE